MFTFTNSSIKKLKIGIALLSLLSVINTTYAQVHIAFASDVRVARQVVEHPSDYDTSTILVQFKNGLTDSERARVVSGFDGSVQRTFRLIPGLAEVRVGTTVGDALSVLRASKDVIAAEPNYRFELADVPNDPNFSKQWALDSTTAVHIDAVRAWGLRKGTQNLRIAVLDTGIDKTHPEFADNIWTNQNEVAGDGIDNDANGYIDDVNGWDFSFTAPGVVRANGDNNPADGNGHGTHVSGIIAAQGNNALGITGICWDAAIVPLKVVGDDGSGYTSWMIAALDYCVRNGIPVANASIGGASYSGFCKAAIEAAGKQGNLLFVAAAGNNGTDNDATPFYPASYDLPNIISVASTTSTGSLSSFSNRGLSSVDIAAPGSSITSTYPHAKVASGYTTLSGTSMAAPMVTAVAALLSENRPEWGFAEIKQALVTSVTRLNGLSTKVASGGVLNAYQALMQSNKVELAGLILGRDVLRGGDLLTAEVVLDRSAAAGGVTVELSSTNPAVHIPSTVQIPGGASSATFTGSVSSVGKTTTGDITAIVQGTTLGVPVTVKPPVLAAVQVDLVQIAPGGTTQGMVTLQQPAGESGLDVALSASDLGITLPPSVHIEAGQVNASFSVDVATACVPGTYQITASTDSNNVSVDVSILATKLEGLSFVPNVVVSSQATSLHVTLSASAPAGGLRLTLSGDDTRLSIPSSVNIAAGSSEVDVRIVAPVVSVRTVMSLTAGFYGTTKAASVQVVPCSVSAIEPTVNDLAAGASTPVTIRLTGPAGPGGVDVYLTDSSGVLSVPSLVHIVEGQTSTVVIAIAAQVMSRASVSLVATDGITSLSVPIVVTPVDIALVSLGATAVTGGVSVSATVTLAAPAPGSGADVTLLSNHLSVLVPTVIHIPSGAISTVVEIGTSPVRDKVIANVTATAGSYGQSKALTVNPAALLSVKVVQASMVGGNSQQGTVLLSGVAPVGGVTVTLSTSNVALRLPASVVIPGGATSASFTITSGSVAVKASGLVGAQLGSVKKTTSVSVNPPSLSAVVSSRSKIVGGEAVDVTIHLTGVAPVGGVVTTLTSANIAITVPATVYIPAGQSSAVITVSSHAVSKLVSVKVSGKVALTTKSTYVSVSPK